MYVCMYVCVETYHKILLYIEEYKIYLNVSKNSFDYVETLLNLHKNRLSLHLLIEFTL